MKHKLLLLFLALGLTAHASSSWYVDGVHGSDSNDCKSLQHACKTIGHAITLASSGDSILVVNATYNESLTIGFNLNVIGYGTSVTAPIVVVIHNPRGSGITISDTGAHVTLSNLTIAGNSATNGGGVNNAGTLTIFNSAISGNGASNGGGIYNAGTLTISNSAIQGNSASNGGGIDSAGTLTISDSLIGGNSASTGGGIGDPGLGGTTTIFNSTLYGNSAGPGGGIYNTSRTLTISNSTVDGNSGSDGGNIYTAVPATTTFQNSIVAAASPNCFGPVTSNGYNLSSDDTCNFHSAGDLVNTDPKLGQLMNNGGLTQTLAELPGSPAIDAGNPSGCTDGLGHLLTTDQRGYPRPDKPSTPCDMGAYEFQGSNPGGFRQR